MRWLDKRTRPASIRRTVNSNVSLAASAVEKSGLDGCNGETRARPNDARFDCNDDAGTKALVAETIRASAAVTAALLNLMIDS
jgi:hypothetical protein